jgi:hypothetical protein
MNVKDFLKVVSEQIQRLNEVQPTIPDAVIKAYNEKFKDEPPTIARPHETNGLVEIKIFLDEATAEPVTAPAPAPETNAEVVPKPKPAFRYTPK